MSDDETGAGGGDADAGVENTDASVERGDADIADATSDDADTTPTEAAHDDRNRCDYCRLAVPDETVAAERDGQTYHFCCGACRDAFADREQVFTEYHGFRRVESGVAGVDAGLPQGLPRNAFVLVSGQAGTRDAELHAELVWRTLQRGEPAAVMTFQEPPGAVVQQFVSMDWNVLPFLESGDLHIVDCFTYRLEDRERTFDRLNDWNQHIYGVAEDATVVVRDPTDVGAIENKLDNCLETLGASDEGLVLIDSLTELGTHLQPVQAYDFVKDVRADVCKGRFVPVFAGATFRGDGEEFPHDLEYVVDGIVDLRLDGETVPDTLLKQVRIRKMNGVLAIPEWRAYEFTGGLGMVTFDPEEEMEKAARDREAADGRPAVRGGDGEDGEPAADGRSGDGESEGDAESG